MLTGDDRNYMDLPRRILRHLGCRGVSRHATWGDGECHAVPTLATGSVAKQKINEKFREASEPEKKEREATSAKREAPRAEREATGAEEKLQGLKERLLGSKEKETEETGAEIEAGA